MRCIQRSYVAGHADFLEASRHHGHLEIPVSNIGHGTGYFRALFNEDRALGYVILQITILMLGPVIHSQEILYNFSDPYSCRSLVYHQACCDED